MNWRRGLLTLTLVCAVVGAASAVVALVQATEDARDAWTLLGLSALLAVFATTSIRRR